MKNITIKKCYFKHLMVNPTKVVKSIKGAIKLTENCFEHFMAFNRMVFFREGSREYNFFGQQIFLREKDYIGVL